MTVLRAGNHAVIDGEIRMPRVGVWHADLHVDTDKPDAGSITLKAEHGLELRGAVVRGDAWNASTRLLIVGGAAGLRKELASKFYKSVPLRLPLSDLLNEAKEALSPSSDADVLERDLAKWSRFASPAYVALPLLIGSARIMAEHGRAETRRQADRTRDASLHRIELYIAYSAST